MDSTGSKANSHILYCTLYTYTGLSEGRFLSTPALCSGEVLPRVKARADIPRITGHPIVCASVKAEKAEKPSTTTTLDKICMFSPRWMMIKNHQKKRQSLCPVMFFLPLSPLILSRSSAPPPRGQAIFAGIPPDRWQARFKTEQPRCRSKIGHLIEKQGHSACHSCHERPLGESLGFGPVFSESGPPPNRSLSYKA